MVVKRALVAASTAGVVRTAATKSPMTKSVARRFVAGETEADAVAVAADLAAAGMHCSIEYLGPEVVTADDARDVVTANLRLLAAIEAADLLDRCELSVQLSDLGLDQLNGEEVALENAQRIVRAATEAETFVTVDAERYADIDENYAIVDRLREEFPKTGVTVQAYLRRCEHDCLRFAVSDSRVRLVKGAYAEPDVVAYESIQDIDLSYVRGLKTLFAGSGTPLVATHDPRLIDIASALAVRMSRERGSYEIQMLYGVRTAEQMRLAAAGERVRVFVPYGPGWYPYLVRRMAEKPANLALLARSIPGRA